MNSTLQTWQFRAAMSLLLTVLKIGDASQAASTDKFSVVLAASRQKGSAVIKNNRPVYAG